MASPVEVAVRLARAEHARKAASLLGKAKRKANPENKELLEILDELEANFETEAEKDAAI
jgi:hypothetical protein